MKKSIRIISLAIVALLFSVSSMAAEKITMGYFNLIPHVFYDKTTKELKGAAVDYFNNVASDMGYEVIWSGPLPFPRLMSYLKEGKIDGSLMMNKNPERESFLYYPKSPYYLVRRIFVVKKENELKEITSVKDTAGYRIGFMRNAHLSPFIKDNMDQFTLELIGGEGWIEQNLMKLIAGRLDAVYDLNSESMLYQAKRMKIDDKIKILWLPEPPGGVYIVFSKNSENGKSLLDSYEQAIQSSKHPYEDFLQPYIK